MTGAILVAGVGNEYRSDDGLGIFAAREIRRRNIPGVQVQEFNGEGAAMMEAWEKHNSVIIVDAISSGAAIGDVRRLDAVNEEIPADFFRYSSHSFGILEAIAMARQLHRLPETLLLYGIEGKHFDVGIGLTDAVLRSMPALLSHIEDELRQLCNHLPKAAR
jgi:hydrogenase maturation protease